MLCLLAPSLAPAPARAFDFMRHGLMTKQMMAQQGLSADLVEIVAWGSMWPDINGCQNYNYCDFSWHPGPDPSHAGELSPYHFDDNNISGGLDLTYNEMLTAQYFAGFSQNPDLVAQGYSLLGQVMHTVQDFYAHSNYLEINSLYVASNGLAALPLWEGQPFVGVPYPIHGQYYSGLITGYYLGAHAAGAVTHAWLNKDNWYSEEGAIPINLPGIGLKNFYAAVSGSFTKNTWYSETYTDAGLAPRHTIRALTAFRGGDQLFRYYFAPQQAPRRLQPAEVARRIADTEKWAATDATLQSIADAIGVLEARIIGDSTYFPPPSWFDAYGVPNPSVVSVLATPESRGGLLASVGPNPSTGPIECSLRASRDGRLRVSVYDASGRFVANLLNDDVGAGTHSVRWSGLDASGRRAPAGVYLVRATGLGLDETRRIVRVR